VSAHRVTLIPGDGIGPEVVDATRRVLEATGVEFDWDVQLVGQPALDAHGTPLPDSVAESVIANRVALKGPVSTPKVKGFRSVNIALRVASGLYANVRPCRVFPGVPSRFDGVDIAVIRDVTEDLYAGIEATAGSPEAAHIINAIREVMPHARLADDAAITSSKQIDIELVLAAWTLGVDARSAFLVDTAIELLQVGQVGREEVLDDFGVHDRKLTELGDHAAQEHDDQVGAVVLDAIVLQRDDLVLGRSQAHHPGAMELSFAIDIALWQREREFGFECHDLPCCP